MTKEASSLVEIQHELEEVYSKNELMPRVRREFETTEGFLEHLEAHAIPKDFGLDVLAQMALHKRANLATMLGLLWHHLKNGQATADMLLKCAEADLVTYSCSKRLFIVMWTLTPETVTEVERYQYPLPMVVEPMEVSTNKETGYLINRGSLILRNNHHDDDICLDHINSMNKIKLTINAEVATMVANKWKHLDKPKDGEEKGKYEARVRAFKKYDRTTKAVMQLIMDTSDHFYLTHKYDKRGRTYSQGYHINVQGNPWNKAVIEFHNKELVDGT